MKSVEWPDPCIRLVPGWLREGEADRLVAQLLEAVQWEVHRLRIFGREVDAPRLSCWIGDADARYRYSGVGFAPRPWPACLLPVRERLAQELGVDFNSVLANRYRDGRDGMGWHRDDEPELGARPVIASLSLGAVRRFVLKSTDPSGRRLALDLPHGSLLVMGGDTQARYRHALSKTRRPVGERINLTFRRIL